MSNLRQSTTSTKQTPSACHNQQQQDIYKDIEAVSNQQQHDQVGNSTSNSSSSSSSKRSIIEGSISSAEQVVTSLQVSSKKESPDDKTTNVSTAATNPSAKAAATALLQQQQPITIMRLKKEKPKYVLDPSGSVYYHWSMVVSFAFLYNFWSLSYRFAFREIDYDSMATWFALDYSADFIYLMDIVINSRTGYLEDGVLQRNVMKVRHHYSECTIFYLDCLCLLPLDVLYLSFGFNSILRCARLVKIYKFWSYVDRTERHTNYPNVFRTFALVHYILVIFHWNACLFHMISKNKIIDIESLYKINDNRCYDILCQYLHAFYWSTLALTTIGDLPRPRTKGEYIYVTVELFFGLFLFASVLGHVANIVTNVSAARKEFQAKLDAVKTFMRMRRVSIELQNKVIRWFDYLWISQQSSDEDKSVACLPDRLKAEIAIQVHLDTLKRVDIFQNTEAGFLCELVLRLKPVLFSPGDYVCRKNEVGHEMYIVSRGILEVVTDEGKIVVATLKAGSYFGEISVLNVGLAGNKRTASVRSVGYSDLFCLNKQDLWDVLKNYPNAEARIRARAEERLSKLDINSSQRRRSSGERTRLSQLAKSQLDQHQQQQQHPRTSRSRRFHSSSCGCFANGKAFSSGSNNNAGCSLERRASANKPECVCRECLTESLAGQQTGRPRMPFIRCHKSRASLNSTTGPCRRAGMSCRPQGCFVVSRADNDQPDVARCRLDPNCRSHKQQQQQQQSSNWPLNHLAANHEPVSYSRSFDQTARARQQQQRADSADEFAANSDDSSADNNDNNDNDDNNLTMTIGATHPAHTADDLANKARQRFPLARRSSSAEPPLEADSWRQLRQVADPNSWLARTGRGRQQQHSSIDEDCTGCARQVEAARRRQRRRHQQHQQHHHQHQHQRITERRDHSCWPASAEGSQAFVGHQPTPMSGYWILQQQQQQQQQPQQQPASNQTATFIQVPMQQPATSVTMAPDSQRSSSLLFGGGGLAGHSATATHAHSMSTMYLNLQPPKLGPHQQAALLSPALPSLQSMSMLTSTPLAAVRQAQNAPYFELSQAERQQPSQAAKNDSDADDTRKMPNKKQEDGSKVGDGGVK